jgi:hypothetical protein
MENDINKKIAEIESEIKQLAKNQKMHNRAIKGLRGSILTISSKEARLEEEARLQKVKDDAIAEYRLNKNIFRRFVRFIGGRGSVVALVTVFMAWALSFVDKGILVKIVQFLK